jgi:hypothetical protein
MTMSYLGRHVGRSAADAEDIDRLARAAWRSRGVALIDPDRVADPWAAQVVRNVAVQLYGPREPDEVDTTRNAASAAGRAFRDW